MAEDILVSCRVCNTRRSLHNATLITIPLFFFLQMFWFFKKLTFTWLFCLVCMFFWFTRVHSASYWDAGGVKRALLIIHICVAVTAAITLFTQTLLTPAVWGMERVQYHHKIGYTALITTCLTTLSGFVAIWYSGPSTAAFILTGLSVLIALLILKTYRTAKETRRLREEKEEKENKAETWTAEEEEKLLESIKEHKHSGMALLSGGGLGAFWFRMADPNNSAVGIITAKPIFNFFGWATQPDSSPLIITLIVVCSMGIPAILPRLYLWEYDRKKEGDMRK